MTHNTRALIKAIVLSMLVSVGVSMVFFMGRVSVSQKYSDQQMVEQFNKGFRAGAMDRLTSLVYCDGVTDENVTRDYFATVSVLQRMGEFDTTPYQCTE